MSRRDLIRLVVVAVLIGVGAIIVRATSPSANSASTAIGHAPSGASVLVASPLAPVVMQMAPADRISIGSAEALASQVIAGAPSDVLITTDTATALVLQSKGLTGPPVVIAHDRLVVITPPSNPGRIHAFADLAKPGVRLVVGGPDSSIGRDARAALAHVGATAALANVVHEAPDAGAITTAVVLGNADAAVVYASQAQALGRRVRTLSIPGSAQPVISDTAAVLTAAPHPGAAAAFLRYLTGPNGRAYLERFGFSVP